MAAETPKNYDESQKGKENKRRKEREVIGGVKKEKKEEREEWGQDKEEGGLRDTLRPWRRMELGDQELGDKHEERKGNTFDPK